MLYGKNDSEDADVIDVKPVKELPEKQKRFRRKNKKYTYNHVWLNLQIEKWQVF